MLRHGPTMTIAHIPADKMSSTDPGVLVRGRSPSCLLGADTEKGSGMLCRDLSVGSEVSFRRRGAGKPDDAETPLARSEIADHF